MVVGEEALDEDDDRSSSAMMWRTGLEVSMVSDEHAEGLPADVSPSRGAQMLEPPMCEYPVTPSSGLHPA